MRTRLQIFTQDRRLSRSIFGRRALLLDPLRRQVPLAADQLSQVLFPRSRLPGKLLCVTDGFRPDPGADFCPASRQSGRKLRFSYVVLGHHRVLASDRRYLAPVTACRSDTDRDGGLCHIQPGDGELNILGQAGLDRALIG